MTTESMHPKGEDMPELFRRQDARDNLVENIDLVITSVAMAIVFGLFLWVTE